MRETLKMANAEDLNRLTSCSLVLLSHVFLSIGNCKESMNMVTPAMQLASKIPDIHVQLWGSAILKDLHRMSKDVLHEKEAYANHLKYSENLIADQLKCVHSMHHNLIDWLKGPPPATCAVPAITAGPSNSSFAAKQFLPTTQQFIQQPTQSISMVNANIPSHPLQQLHSQPTNPTLHMPAQSAIQHHQLTMQPIASTSTQHQQQILSQQSISMQQQLPPQPQVILNQSQQSVQYIHQPIGPQVQQQFGQYY